MRALWGLGLLLAASGCGGGYYAIVANSATSRVEEARALGAETLAPYEYYYAKEHLHQAALEASEANYSDASNLAEQAEEYASKAIQLAQAAHRGSGKP